MSFQGIVVCTKHLLLKWNSPLPPLNGCALDCRAASEHEKLIPFGWTYTIRYVTGLYKTCSNSLWPFDRGTTLKLAQRKTNEIHIVWSSRQQQLFTTHICSHCTALLINADVTLVLHVTDYKPQTTDGLRCPAKQSAAALIWLCTQNIPTARCSLLLQDQWPETLNVSSKIEEALHSGV